ncbi:MAG: MCE family protein [Nitrospirae bacterium]|nr:MCE family protein [Nitrospirota bacterium]
MRETDPRFIGLKKKVGLFFIIAIIGIITTLIFVGIERGIFKSKYRIYFTVDKGTGFFEGMPVKLSGFKIGKIETLSLDENARVKVGLLLFKKYQKWIRQDSKAILTREGLIGESVIAVTVGDLNKQAITDGESIGYEKTKGLDEIVAEDVRPLVIEIREIVRYINDPQGDIKQTLGNLKTLSADLHTTRENVDKLLKNTDGNISNVASNISKTSKDIGSLAGNVDKAISNIERKIIPAIDSLGRAIDNTEKATSDIKSAVEKSAPKVPSLLNKGEDTLDGANDVVKSLKKVWPIRLFIEEPKEGLLYGDSYE